MTTQTYAPWPFRPFAARSIEEAARWWQQCYLPGDVSRILPGYTHWRVITGGPGSGKSVALADVEQHEASRSLIVHYPPERWPGAPQAFLKDDSHLAQIMVGAALALRDHLTESPDQIELLTSGQCVVLRWLLDRFLGSRTFIRWIDGLPKPFATHLRKAEFEDLYASTTQSADVYGQIDDLVSLAKRLGFQRVLLSIDLNSRDAHRHLEKLGELFGWLDLMHHAGLSLIAAIPTDAAETAALSGRARGRISIVELDWSLEQVREIAMLHIRAALPHSDARLESYADPALLTALEAILRSEFGGIAPQGWIMLSESLLYLATRTTPQPTLPFTLDQKSEVVRELFLRHFPLELVEKKGVWRGPKFIPFDPQLIRFTEIVWSSPDYPVSADDPDVRRLLNTVKPRKSKKDSEDKKGAADRKGYIHTLAHRVRELIEPEPSDPIYLINERGEGYLLENVVRRSRQRSM